MTKIPMPSTPDSEMADIRARLRALETNMGRPFKLISTPANSANQNQTVPPVGNFNGVIKYDVTMLTACTFRLVAPTPIIWFSYATLRLSAPGGGSFAYLTTAVSLSPWDNTMVIFESGSQIFDVGNLGYLQSEHHFSITDSQTQGATGPGAAPLGITSNMGPLPAGIYEVRQRLVGDNGTQAAYYQGNVEVYSTGG